MGDDPSTAEARRELLAPYRLDEALMDARARRRDRPALPARPPGRGDHRGASCTATGQAIWDQAENRLHAQKALLELLLHAARRRRLVEPVVAPEDLAADDDGRHADHAELERAVGVRRAAAALSLVGLDADPRRAASATLAGSLSARPSVNCTRNAASANSRESGARGARASRAGRCSARARASAAAAGRARRRAALDLGDALGARVGLRPRAAAASP